ncbi:unnamed protein product [Caenorhabditis bovis]|uniref:Uncharacterized protein n=1 Tax=Caenorhabditis bovis TaxID=2654633 RepID=A0A8S1EHQ4_9PELO|nr:unnamed protein product [Caenorhabditis bovis]
MKSAAAVSIITISQLIHGVNCFSKLSAEDRLLSNIFEGYNSLIRPVHNASSPPVVVYFSLALVLLINVDEKNQIMQTNVWPTMKWNDYHMKWNPKEYDGIETVRVPPDKVWLPDIVLFNNADGNYLVSFYSNVVVEHTGDMLWVPPAVYKSSCLIDVEYFPFDEQVCSLTFGSWSFGNDELQLSYLSGKRHAELNDYLPSGIWDLTDAPGLLSQSRSKISYLIKIRRKSLFYTVILIMPTVLMAFLSMMVFYLPAESSEKITLAISILLALVVFLLVVSKILPPTSSTIPLLAKYLLMTFIMNMVTIMVSVIIINVYFRGPATHIMQDWVKIVFLKYLPMLLIMQRPDGAQQELTRMKRENREKRYLRSPFALLFKRGDRQREEWKFVSGVIDKLLLYIFFAVTTGGTLGILLSAPNVFEQIDQTAVIEMLKKQAAEEMLN